MRKSLGFIALLLLCSCEHKELCYHHPHDARVRIDVDWSKFEKDVPSGMTVMIYPKDGGKEIAHLSNTTSHVYVNLPAGLYHSIVFNQSESEYGSVAFRGMENYETAEVYSQTARSSWYETRIEDGRLGVAPEWIGSDNEVDMLVTDEMVETTGIYMLQNGRAMPDYVIGSHAPTNIIYTVMVTVHVKGFHNLRSARASLDGLAEGYLLGKGKYSELTVTQLMEEWTKEVDTTDPTKGKITTTITCFGLPDGHTGSPEENIFDLSLLLVDNKTVKDFSFNVGDKFVRDNSADVDVNVSLSLELELEIADPLPDVKPEGGSGGGFDAEVEDWGPVQNIDIPL